MLSCIDLQYVLIKKLARLFEEMDSKEFLLKTLALDDDWQVICEHSLFSNRLHQLEEICHKEYNGDSSMFIHNYLRPVVELLDTIRSRCEDYYQAKTKKDNNNPPWTEQFDNIVKFAIHPSALRIELHKGDFYIHISSSIPRTLELEYYHCGEVFSRTLSMTDSILMCSENWTELLRSETRDRFIYLNCILWTIQGFEKVSWAKVIKAQFTGTMEPTSHDFVTQEHSSVMADHDSINLEEFSIKPLLILDLNFELLHSQVAFITGSRDIRGGPVIFLNASRGLWDSTDMNPDELAKLLMYYYRIPRDSVQLKGCSLVIDARDGRHTRGILQCIGEAILLFQIQVPGAVHLAYVLTKKDSLMLLLSASKVKDNLNFQFQFISSVEKLCRVIPMDQLPISYGGQMNYDHDNWIKFRTKVEPFMTGCRSAAKHALNSMQELSKSDLGFTVEDCTLLLKFHKEKAKEVLEDTRLLGLCTEGKQIIERLNNEIKDFLHLDDYRDTLACVDRLYCQMDRVFEKLQAISEKRTKNLELCLSVRSFEEESQKTIAWMHSDGFPFLEKHDDIADSLGRAQSLMDEFTKFSEHSEEYVLKAEECVLNGKYLTDLDELAVDKTILREKLNELERTTNEYSLIYHERKKKLKKCVQFHTLVQDTNSWWTSGLQYIAHMNMEEIQTRDGIERLKTSIKTFIQNNPPITESQIARITELAHYLGSKQVEQAELVSSRCLEAQEVLQVKQNQILGAERRYNKINQDSLIPSDGDENSSGFKDDDLSTEPDEDEYHEKVDYTESVTSIDGVVGPIYSWKEDEAAYDENDAKLAVYDAAMPAKMKERLRYIINEMVDTEHEYCRALEYIFEHYLPAMDKEQLPATLRGKKNVLFGNIERIYDFHKRYFSQELESYLHAPLQIGKCFLKWERQFYLYALYNKNKPKSDQLWDDFANAYFQTKMRELHDKLDLASYLIKPVQRLGKYALMLRDIINCCDKKDPRVVEMNSAHELMKFQLRHGNDLLAMDSIRHSDVNLKEQGCLIRQADFIVWYRKRKRVRRVFLFEHVLVFTKSKKQKSKGDIFTYKHSIKTGDLGLTENIGDSGLKFEVWYRRWKKGRTAETFVLQAITINMKTDWTNEITRVLWRQANRNKEYGLTEATTGISVESTPSSIFLDSGSSNSGHNHNYSRSRTLDISARQNEVPSNKRLSWISAGESSGSSGVCDLGSLPEDAPLVYSPRDDLRTFFKQRSSEQDIKYSSLPRRKLSYQHSISKADIVFESNSVARRETQAGYDGTFIRNNIYRKTLQIEPTKIEHSKTAPKKRVVRRNYSSGGRYATQPIVMPSSLSFTEGLTVAGRSRFKKELTSECDIGDIVEEELNDLNKNEMNPPITHHATAKRHLSKYSEANLSNYTRLPTSRSLPETTTENATNTLTKRRHSYSKSMSMSNIVIDERQKGKDSRQRSDSTESSSSSSKSQDGRRHAFHNLFKKRLSIL